MSELTPAGCATLTRLSVNVDDGGDGPGDVKLRAINATDGPRERKETFVSSWTMSTTVPSTEIAIHRVSVDSTAPSGVLRDARVVPHPFDLATSKSAAATTAATARIFAGA
jgi:hypothetical protein